MTGSVHRPASYEFLLASRTDDRAVKEAVKPADDTYGDKHANPVNAANAPSAKKPLPSRISHHAGKRATQALPLQANMTSSADPAPFKMPVKVAKAAQEIAIPSELQSLNITADSLDGTLEAFLDALIARQKSAFAEMLLRSQ